MKSLFLCILLNENYHLKAKLVETKLVHRVMHALSLNSKFLMERNIFPTFLATQIDRTSQAQVPSSSTDR